MLRKNQVLAYIVHYYNAMIEMKEKTNKEKGVHNV
jgi:hypothetical protein